MKTFSMPQIALIAILSYNVNSKDNDYTESKAVSKNW